MDLAWLAPHYSFRTLIDIGASDGAFGAYLQRAFAIARVIAFEPLAAHAAALTARGYELHATALSDHDGEADLFIAASDVGSSLLRPTAQCTEEYPQIRTVAAARVPVRRLDDCVAAAAPDVFVKMDAQGAEAAIIRGGRRVIGAARAVYVEMSFAPLYEGAALFNEVHAELAQLGFALRGFRGQHLSARTGEPLFTHCLYLRDGAR